MKPFQSSFKACPGQYRAMFAALALLPLGCSGQNPASPPPTPVPAAAAPAPQTPPGKPLSELESLVAPIALYPDPLLAEMLVAATYPLEVVQAARWLDSKPDPATLKSKDWDASILRLVEVPQILKMMNDHLDWTTQLGDAFLAKPAELMDTIQALRRRAIDAGFLKDTPEQKVSKKTVSQETASATESTGSTVKATPAVVQKEVVYIEPAKSDTVYVPQYDPAKVYSAPLAPPPASTANYSYPATSAAYPAPAPATSYYPAYYPPATTTTTTSTTDPWLTFGAGALVGGLLTWGIMEWSHHDDYYHGGYYGGYYPPVSHYYGNTVCRNGNCWHGGGGGYGGRYNNVNIDRGDINISDNNIKVDRDGYFKADQLPAMKNRVGWQPEARHRRGQQYPAGAQERWGQIKQPALAGDRLGSAQTLPANVRGFDGGVARAPGERRPSSAEVRERLGQDTKLQEKFGGGQQRPNRPATADVRPRPNALDSVREPDRNIRQEGRRGAESRQKVQATPRNNRPAEKPAVARREEGLGSNRERPQSPGLSQRRPESSQRFERPQTQPSGGRDINQLRDNQRRQEMSRPNAFEGAANRGGMQDFSRRGAASRQNRAGGGGGFQGGGGRFGGGGGGSGLRGRR